ncbi:hypothetical protein Ocin01_08309 [Orchesella cincta]|uniref:Uncharacterized protein n=1 Tax=Orchesella cincta TaxID=48709 RepID=A0A1D2MZ89_ORCCI|nr:hypothetical protein Ocin01_08309 [Orchesella cincta]
MTKGKFLICGAIALTWISMASATSVVVGTADDIIDQMSSSPDVAYRLKQAIKAAKQIENGPLQQAVRTNFLHTLYLMANASAVIGTNVSRSSATLIRGFVQDSFNLGSIGVYLPRLIFLDGPSQFIETLRLVRTNQIRIPSDMDSAMDTLINFASSVRDAPVTNNVSNPFLSFFPNIFHGAESLAGRSIMSSLQGISPGDINIDSASLLNNRWDRKSSTTAKSLFHE